MCFEYRVYHYTMASRILSKMEHIGHTKRVLNATHEVLEKVHSRLHTHERTFGYTKHSQYHLPDDMKITIENTLYGGFNQMSPTMKQKYREDLVHILDSYLKEEGMASYVSTNKHTHPRVVVTVHKDTFNKRA